MEKASLIETLEAILAVGDDYVSHRAALWMHGVVSELPDPITIVSSSRRRDRHIDGHRIHFVYHREDRPRQTCSLDLEGRSLRVATIEQALVDLLADVSQTPSAADLGRLLADRAAEPHELIRLAADTGDAVCKKSLLWLVWAGKIGWDDLPPHLPRNPVVWNAHTGQSVWSGDLYVRFPLDWLRLTPPGNAVDDPWLELLQYQPFRDYLCETGRLPIRDDPRVATLDYLKQFARHQAERLLQSDVDSALKQLVPWVEGAGSEGGLPKLLRQWLDWGDVWPRHLARSLVPWAQKAMKADEPERRAIGLWLAGRIGLLSEALAALPASGPLLFRISRGDVVYDLCAGAERAGMTLAVPVRIVYARFLIRDERIDEALKQIDVVRRQQKTELDTRVVAELSYLCGLAHRHARRFVLAEKELLAARCAYETLEDRARVLAVDLALGNLELSLGRLNTARHRYLAALNQLEESTPTTAAANLLYNLGLLEYKACRFERAVRFLHRSRERYRALGYASGETAALITMGKASLLCGDFCRGLRQFQLARGIQQHAPGGGHVQETTALMAWANELLGRAGPAVVLWQQIENESAASLPPASAFLIESLQVMRLLLHGDAVPAARQLQTLRETARTMNVPADELGALHFQSGLAHLSLKEPAKACRSFARALETMKDFQDLCPALLCRAVAGICFPARFSCERLGSRLQTLTEDRYYDPFWHVYALPLWELGIPEGQTYLWRHYRLTPPERRLSLRNRYPELTRVWSRLARLATSAERLTLLQNGKVSRITHEEYVIWKETKPVGFRFDGPAGELTLRRVRRPLQTGSYPHRLLSQVLLAFPDPIELPALYRSIWGGAYDAETDAASLKASLLRLKSCLLEVSPTLRLVWEGGWKAPGRLRLIWHDAWEAVI